ncbi:Ferritin heavy polypeptide-like 17 [Microtus ochrogaster]|uniref:Ferritin n=1 Tax=Microtus ochrogaster TaxID=79684 RepID=A0A8J6GQ23_MICOH|nr:Ferritin heavy polypeptide-like 17 [Microtus ochrogaster]
MFVFLQNQGGGCTFLRDISGPDRDSWHGGIQAMEYAFHMEMIINQSLLNMHALVKGRSNADLCNFLEQCCLKQQVQVLKDVRSYLTNLCHMGAPENHVAEYLLEKLSLS